MVGCIGDFNGMVGLFLGMVEMARFSSSLSSSSSSISSLVVPLMIILGSWLLVTIAGEVSYLSTIVTCSSSFASFFLMGWYFIVLGVIVGESLMVSLGVVSGVFGSGLGDYIRYCIRVLIPGTMESCGVNDSISFTAISTNSSKDVSEEIWGLTSRLSLMSMASRSLCFAE